MSYVVFALKWRPKIFNEVIGQKHVVLTLENAIKKSRLAHAYIFSGPRGVGKTSCARILAKSMNCIQGPTVTPCGVCPSCVDISASRSLDVIEIDGASNRGIDEIRALRENVKFSPAQGKFKVYIIDEVHQITSEGFNALLKTLEEPPPFVKFIFATTHPQKVPSTILSRCQRLDFRRISTLEIISQLEKVCAQEKINVDNNVLAAIAKSCDGSLRDAESVLDQLFSFSRDKILIQDVVAMLGLVEQDVFFSIAEHIKNKNPREALELFNRVLDEGKDTVVFLNSLIEHFRNIMIAKVAQADSGLIDLPQDICKRLLEQARLFSLEEIFNIFNALVNAQELTKRLQFQRIPLEICLVKLASDDSDKTKKNLPSEPSKAVIKHVDKKSSHDADKNERDNKHPQPLKQPSAVKKEEAEEENHGNESILSITYENIKEGWLNFINSMSKIKISVGTYLNEGEPISLKGNVLNVSFPKNYSFHKESLEGKENRILVEDCLRDVFGEKLKVNFILSQVEKSHDTVQNNPIFKTAINMFNARVVQTD